MSSKASDQRAVFDQAVTNMLQCFRTIDPQYPALVTDMKKTIQTMYTAFATISQQNQLKRERMSHLQSENHHLKQEILDLVAFRGHYNDSLLDALTGIKSILASPDYASSSNYATDELTKNVQHVQEKTEDSIVWQKKVHRLYLENTTLRDRVELLENDCADLSASIDVLKRELCGRIQQVQLFSQGLANTDNSTYSRLLSEMQQNTMKAMAQADMRRKRHEDLVTSLHAPLTTRGTSGAKHTLKQLRKQREVVINRGSSGIGMRIQGGTSESGVFTPVLVDTVYPDLPADKCGEVFVGDEIVAIGDVKLKNMKHTDILKLFQECGEKLVLTLVSSFDIEDPSVTRHRNIQRGVQHLKTSAFKNAVDIFSSIVDDANEDDSVGPIVYAYRASGLLALGRLDEAEQDCRRALSLKVIPLPLYVLSRICESRDQLHSALQFASFACRLDSSSASLRTHKTHLHELLERKTASIEKGALKLMDEMNLEHATKQQERQQEGTQSNNEISTSQTKDHQQNHQPALPSHPSSESTTAPTSTRTQHQQHQQQ
eukprot:m.43847 g.43847  ORF g.43847 m.43847 type:complete len:545 (+) comp7132_c1_seq2:114-1748(+)